jgi:hypothetical protein
LAIWRSLQPHVNARILILPAVLAIAACSGSRSCSTTNRTSGDLTPEPLPPAPAATPDPAAEHRAQLLARIDKLPDSECDNLVLQFQLIPRDEILDPISKPRKELLRYVRRIASAEELEDLERAIKERMEHNKKRMERKR